MCTCLPCAPDTSVLSAAACACLSNAVFHGALYFLLLVLLTIALAYWFANSDFAERFFQFPLGRHQPAFPYLQQWPGSAPAAAPEHHVAGMGGEL